MDRRPKYKTKNYNTPRGNTGENLGVLRFGNVFLDPTSKVRSMKEKKMYLKLKSSALQKQNKTQHY